VYTNGDSAWENALIMMHFSWLIITPGYQGVWVLFSRTKWRSSNYIFQNINPKGYFILHLLCLRVLLRITLNTIFCLCCNNLLYWFSTALNPLCFFLPQTTLCYLNKPCFLYHLNEANRSCIFLQFHSANIPRYILNILTIVSILALLVACTV